MRLIVGLGNPGLKYKKTRHNMGWLALDFIYKQLTTNNKRLSKWKKVKNIQAELSEGNINGDKVILAKLLTYMNESGIAVKTLLTNLRLTTNDLIVVHDDFDIEFGKYKVQSKRGASGHNGVKSIIDILGTKDFTRIRIGIRPIELNIPDINTERFVLQRFSKEELKKLKIDVFPQIVSVINFIASSTESAMSKSFKS